METGELLACFPRGKRSEFAVGDQVTVARQAEDQGVITACLPRRSLLFRSDAIRQKLIAANVTQVIVVVATSPGFSPDLVSRCLVAAESQQLRAIVVLNKCDLRESLDPARERLQPFTKLGVPIVEMSALQGAAPLRPFLDGQTSILIGQSGMGKSTLINSLIPDAKAATREISTALGSGKHTTTHAQYYELADSSALIDSPGLQEFGLHHLNRETLASAFVEFRPYLGHCRFRDCRHRREPDCAILEAVNNGQIDGGRIASFHRLSDELQRDA